ncbi:hypothetical protein SAMN04488067_11287 [Halorubrum xinjiangense]|uniref:Uncharacterized protein n=1 Tax=Halorubrum xinjiangense TaxID=261291 RepID=A0A1G7QS05_9EURY|nr:hypothetical protein [Halorubrum xinjiangense]SDG00440.1 hypothetical protein SAMN04488067_11287 [Halorubrum xinjiangense]
MDTPRRRVLAAAATGSTLGLAGCGDLAGSDGDASEQTDDGSGESDGEDGGSGAGEDASATVALDVQEEIQAAQEDVRTRVEEGNLSQEEAQAELIDAQTEIVSAAIDDLESYAADVDGLAVENANEQVGAALLSGPAAAVLDTLEADPVNALLSAADFPEPQESGQQNDS